MILSEYFEMLEEYKDGEDPFKNIKKDKFQMLLRKTPLPRLIVCNDDLLKKYSTDVLSIIFERCPFRGWVHVSKCAKCTQFTKYLMGMLSFKYMKHKFIDNEIDVEYKGCVYLSTFLLKNYQLFFDYFDNDMISNVIANDIVSILGTTLVSMSDDVEFFNTTTNVISSKNSCIYSKSYINNIEQEFVPVLKNYEIDILFDMVDYLDEITEFKYWSTKEELYEFIKNNKMEVRCSLKLFIMNRFYLYIIPGEDEEIVLRILDLCDEIVKKLELDLKEVIQKYREKG